MSLSSELLVDSLHQCLLSRCELAMSVISQLLVDSGHQCLFPSLPAFRSIPCFCWKRVGAVRELLRISYTMLSELTSDHLLMAPVSSSTREELTTVSPLTWSYEFVDS